VNVNSGESGRWAAAVPLIERLGGERVVGREIRSDLALAEAISDGMPYQVLEHVIKSTSLQRSEVYALVGSRLSLLRRRTNRQNLSTSESDRLIRLVRILALAEGALGGRDKAGHWLRRRSRALAGRRPLDLLASYVGAQMVEDVISRMAWRAQ
jgi:putative toxin-antitoxin system antitoxin component (TIGR02293 family)